VTAEAFDFDWLVIGSGFGGSVSALRLSEKGFRVGVFNITGFHATNAGLCHRIFDSAFPRAHLRRDRLRENGYDDDDVEYIGR